MRPRDGRPVLSPSGDEGSEPSTPLGICDFDPPEGGSRAVTQQFTPSAIPACPDPDEPWLPPTGGFPRDQAQPGRQLAAVCEWGHGAERGDERSDRHRADAGDGLQSLTGGRSLAYGCERLASDARRGSKASTSSSRCRKTSVLRAVSWACSASRVPTLKA
jgi:hypothetical protein